MKRKILSTLLVTAFFITMMFSSIGGVSANTNFIKVRIANDDEVTAVWVEYQSEWESTSYQGSYWNTIDNKLYVSDGIGDVKLQYSDGTILIVPNSALDIGTEGGGTLNVWLDALAVASPAVSITKIADPDSVFAGETVEYTIEVTNTGDTNLTNVVVTDPLTGLNYGPFDLVIGGSLVLPVQPYITTMGDIPQVDNTATVTGWFLSIEVNDEATETVLVEVPPEPSISLTKVADVTSGLDLGDTVNYTLTVTNDGEVDLVNVQLEDTDIGLSSTIGNLAIGASVEVFGSYDITEADIIAGQFINTASVTGETGAGVPVEDTAEETVTTVAPDNSMTLEKAALAGSALNLGDDSFYSFTVTNTGNVTLANVHVEDLILGYSSGNLGSLAPGDSTTFSDPAAFHTIVEADVLLGTFYNEADAYGTFQSTDDTTASDDETIEVNYEEPALELDKSVITPGPYNLGDVVEYGFTVYNNGLVTISNVQVTDILLDGAPFTTEILPALAPGANYTFTATGFHTITEDDVLYGFFYNEAVAVGWFGETPIEAFDSEMITVAEPIPGITIVKSAEAQGPFGIDDDVYYTFVVTNTGDIDIVDVLVSDNVIAVVDNYKAVLAPGEIWTITGEGPYTTTEEDAVAGTHVNTGYVSGMTFLGPVADEDLETIEVVAEPSIELVKTADVTEAAIDDTITYSFTVTNTGDVTLTNVYVYDTTFDHTTLSVELEPGESYTWTDEMTHVVTEDDAWMMYVQNFATAYGTPSTGGEVTDDDDAMVDIDAPMPEITLTKTADPGYAPIGGEITYTFAVANTGNVTLYDIYVSDSQLGFTSTEAITLEPGEQHTLSETATYTLVEMDAYNGGYENTAWAYGYTEEQQEVSDDDMEFVETDAPAPSILLTKTADPATLAQIGDQITYTFEVENTGNVTLYNVYVEDLGLEFTSTEAITLLPGESLVLTETASYTILEADSFAGSYVNTAVAYGYEFESQDPVSDEDTAEIPVARPEPGILLDKAALIDGVAQIGDVVTYEFTVTNTGTVTLYDVVVSDLGLGFTSTEVIILAPGGSLTLAETAEYTITESDAFVGDYTNTALAEGWPAEAEIPVTDEDTEVVDVVDASPAINLDKSVNDNSVTVGDSVNYTIVVTNIGNVTLYDGTISDSMLGISESFDILAPGASIQLGEGYTTDSGDVPSITNTAEVLAYTMNEDEVSDDDSVTVTVTRPVIPPSYNPSISVTIEPDADLVEEGTDVTFTMVVTNTGNTRLNNVEVTNEDLDFETVIPVLYVGGSETFTVVRTMDEAGDFTYTVVAEGTSPQVVAVSDNDVTAVEVFVVPPIEPPPLNPPTGAIPFNALTVSGLMTLGAGVFALIKRKKEEDEEE